MKKTLDEAQLEQVTAKLDIEGVTPEECDIKDAKPEAILPTEDVLSEEQLDKIVEVLEENKENLPKHGDVISGELNLAEGEVLEEGTLPMSADPETGNLSFVPTAEDTEAAAQSFKDAFGVTDEDMIEFINIVNRVKAGEKFSVYNALPEGFKKAVRAVCMSQGADRRYYNTIAKEFLVDQFIQNEEMNNAFDSFNRELEGIYAEIPSMSDMYADTLYQTMTEDLTKKAELVKDSNPEAADKLLKIRDVFIDTYEFTSIKEFIASRKYYGRVIKTRRKNKFEDEMKDFNFLLSKSNLFKWPDATTIKNILLRKLGEKYEIQIEVFLLNLYYSRLGVDLEDVYEAEYTYYILRNIVALDFAEGNSEFNQKLVENLTGVMRFIIGEFSVEEA